MSFLYIRSMKERRYPIILSILITVLFVANSGLGHFPKDMPDGHIRLHTIHPCVSVDCGASDFLHYHAGGHSPPLANQGLDFLHRQVVLLADEQDEEILQTSFPPESRINRNCIEASRRLRQGISESVKTLPFYLIHQVFLH